MKDKHRETSQPQDKPKRQSNRQSARVSISMPIEMVIGDLKVPENAKTMAVNPNGCGILFQRPIEVGSKLLLTNKATKEQADCRVVMCRKQTRSDSYEIGIAFEKPTAKFWGIHFPPDDWDPTTRKKPVAA